MNRVIISRKIRIITREFGRMETARNRVVEHSPGPNPQPRPS